MTKTVAVEFILQYCFQRHFKTTELFCRFAFLG